VTDLEISKALALAIGWKRILPNEEAPALQQCWVSHNGMWRLFSYTDWNVIGPIAERYDAFPFLIGGRWHTYGIENHVATQEDTPQKAIAMAVIGANK